MCKCGTLRYGKRREKKGVSFMAIGATLEGSRSTLFKWPQDIIRVSQIRVSEKWQSSVYTVFHRNQLRRLAPGLCPRRCTMGSEKPLAPSRRIKPGNAPCISDRS